MSKWRDTKIIDCKIKESFRNDFGFLGSRVLKKDEKWENLREIIHIECIWEKWNFEKNGRFENGSTMNWDYDC